MLAPLLALGIDYTISKYAEDPQEGRWLGEFHSLSDYFLRPCKQQAGLRALRAYLCYIIICNEQYCGRCREERADGDHITTHFLEDCILLETSLKRIMATLRL